MYYIDVLLVNQYLSYFPGDNCEIYHNQRNDNKYPHL